MSAYEYCLELARGHQAIRAAHGFAARNAYAEFIRTGSRLDKLDAIYLQKLAADSHERVVYWLDRAEAAS